MANTIYLIREENSRHLFVVVNGKLVAELDQYHLASRVGRLLIETLSVFGVREEYVQVFYCETEFDFFEPDFYEWHTEWDCLEALLEEDESLLALEPKFVPNSEIHEIKD